MPYFVKLSFVFYNKLILLLDLIFYSLVIFLLSNSKLNYVFIAMLLSVLLTKIIYEQLVYAKDVGGLKIFGVSSLSLILFHMLGHLFVMSLSYLGLFFSLKLLGQTNDFFYFASSFFKLIGLDLGLVILLMPFFFLKDILKLLK